MRAQLLLFGLALAACGGSAEDGLFGTGSTGGTPASGGRAGNTGAAGSAGSGVGGAAGGASGGAGGQITGGAAGSGGGAAGGSGGSPSDAGTGGGPNQVGIGPCGSQLCSFSGGAQCCFSSSKGLYCSNDKLSNPCSCSGFGCNTLKIACDGAEDCEGSKKCCAIRSIVGPSYDRVVCRDTCSGITFSAAEVCHPGDKCPDNHSCKPDSKLPPGYSTCQPN